MIVAMPFFCVIFILSFPVTIYFMFPDWYILIISVCSVFAILQVIMTYLEIDEEFEDDYPLGFTETVREQFRLFRFSVHRTFRQYIQSALVPIHGETPFIQQVMESISRRYLDK